MQIGVPTARRMLSGKSANQQRRVPISNRRDVLEVLGELDVSDRKNRATKRAKKLRERRRSRSFFYQN